ncbi:galactosyltransferase-related protein [Bacillus sp. JJ1521]|uniref:galactosyltransferase-related protein n=1 Tax=Bacillus sp. JJ1521 TaxID=3122957 RepID=UPI002FFFBAAD
MYKDVSLLIPFKSDGSVRDANFNWIRKYYNNLCPKVEICIGINTENPFNRSKAINIAAKQATRDIFVIVDADIFCDPDSIIDSISYLNKYRMVIPYKNLIRISEGDTNELVQTNPTWPLKKELTRTDHVYTEDYSGGIMIISRSAFMRIGGFDERFVGWGGEDDAFYLAFNTICGQFKRLNHTIYHLWHQPLGYHLNPNGTNNLKLRDIYCKAFKDKKKMKRVLSESEGIFSRSKRRSK